MRSALLSLACGAAIGLVPAGAAEAMGFGRTITATTLGQPLNFAAVVALDGDESLARECVFAEVLIGDARVAPENVRATLESGRETGERRVRVTTRVVVDEPIVTVDVAVGCGSQVSRRFVSFIDPPVLRLASAEAEALPPQRVEPEVAPLLDIVRNAARTRREPTAPVAVAARPRSPARKVASAGMSTSTSPARTQPRLRLDPAPTANASPRAPVAGVTGSTANTATTTNTIASPVDPAGAQIVAAQAAADAASAALGRERARLQLVEAGMAALKGDADRQQRTLVELQSRLRQAEGERYANGLVYLLAAGVLAFASLAAALWALRPRQRRRARWFDDAARREQRARAAAAEAPAAAVAGHDEPAPGSVVPAVSQHPSQWGESAPGLLSVTTPATIGGLEVTTVLGPQSHHARLADDGASANAATAGEPARPLSSPMEELIDLEQQAEFFVVLGQDEAAIALLERQLPAAVGASPLPYLQLLEIHRRRDDRAAYDAISRRLERRFETTPPGWDDEPHDGRPLDAHPQAIARLQAIWHMPLHAMESLDALLFPRAGGDGEAFDFAAYRDLLFLYGVARDRAGAVETENGPVDLLLPLDDAPTEPMPVMGDSRFAVDLDVSRWPGVDPVEGLVIQRSVGRRGAAG